MQTIGWLVALAAAIGALVFTIKILIIAFHKSVLWGVLCLLVPFVMLLFVILNWDATKKPFGNLIACWGFMLIGAVLGASGMPGGFMGLFGFR